MKDIDAVIATYGTPTPNGRVISEVAALKLFDALKECCRVPIYDIGYYLNEVRMEGDRDGGKIIGTFTSY